MDRDLVRRAQGGDRGAFAELAAGAIGRLYNTAQLMLTDRDLADDAVQETLVAAWRDLRALRDLDRFDSWLHRILIRSVYREAKRERREAARVVNLAADPGTSGDPRQAVEDRDDIERGFRQLTPEYRAVLVVHHYLELGDDEAAELLGIPPGTVKSRLHRASAALRAALEAEARAVDGLTAGSVR